MKISSSILVVVVGFILLISTPVLAQDDLPVSGYQDPSLQEFNNTEDRSVYESSSEGKSLKTVQSISRDTIRAASSSAKPKGAEPKKPGTNKSDDALNFNFLYYIIQKFKISDIVDQ